MSEQRSLAQLARESGLVERLSLHEPLSKHTSFRIGGPADFFAVVENGEELRRWVTIAVELGEPFVLIGRGTNLLFADAGYRGLVIENRCSEFEIDSDSHILTAESGVSIARLARSTAENGQGGLEWAIGIPGTVGGAIVNNAGAYDGDMAAVVRTVTIWSHQDGLRVLESSELNWGYRTSRFRNCGVRQEIILSTRIQLNPETPGALAERINSYRERRAASSPNKPSAGSVFKNPPGASAAELIDQAGLRGKSIGDAQISEEHANYIVNAGHATAQDVLLLIALIQDQVQRSLGVDLELEIEVIGVSQ
jgi:UDP-N-acetylmuramate dehydrogenase